MMHLIKFNHTRFIFICFFILVQLDLLNSQIRFPDDNGGGGDARPTGPMNNNNYGYGNNNNNFNTNWYARPNCQSYRYVPGYCVPQSQCNELRYSRDFNVLRRSLCGFYGNEPKVCCPAQSNTGYPQPNNPYPQPNNPYPNPNNPQPNNPYPNPNNPQPNNPYPPSSNIPANDYSTPPSTSGNDMSEASDNLSFVYPRKLPQPCGISKKEATRVVGGSPALPGAWPWMVSLQHGKPGSRTHLCGAALISSNLVVTASHCIRNDDDSTTSAKMLSVRLGEHDIENNSPDDAAQEFDVAQVIGHPNYTKTFKNDIALLRLNGNVRFNERISPVCLPYDSDLIRKQSLTNRKAMITGWGATAYNGESSPTLLQASLKIVNPNFCKKAFEKWLTITDEYICAASEGFDKDSCQGDSGGPLVLWEPEKKRWYLIGVVSFGKKCASKDTPGVYTRTSKQLAWIQQYI